MKYGKLEKPRAIIAHDSNENQTVEVRTAKGLTNLAKTYYGRRHDILDREVTLSGQRIVEAACDERVFVVAYSDLNETLGFLVERGEFSVAKAIRVQSERMPRYDRCPIIWDEPVQLAAIHSRDGSERDYILLVAAGTFQLEFLEAGLISNGRLLSLETVVTLPREAGDDRIAQEAAEVRGFISRFL